MTVFAKFLGKKKKKMSADRLTVTCNSIYATSERIMSQYPNYTVKYHVKYAVYIRW